MAAILGRIHPPTPPKTTIAFIDDAIRSLDTHFSSPESTGNLGDALPNPAIDNTPPPSSPMQLVDTTGHPPPRKRLRFSTETRICAPTLESQPPTLPTSSRRSLEARSKSILKTNDSLPPRSSPKPVGGASRSPQSSKPQSLAAMLEAILQALRGSDALSKRDAYHTLSSCLRAYRDYPNIDDVLPHLSFFEGVFERDISAGANTLADKKMVEQALQCTFIVMRRLSQQVTTKFRSSMTDHCLHALERGETSKELLKHQLNLLTLVEMYGRTMTVDRARRALKGLATIDEHRAGQNILQLRMIICRNIARHHPNVFVDEVQHHVVHVFHALLSSQREVRVCAIETALSLGASVGHRQRVARAVQILLDTRSDQGISYSEHIRHTLSGMLQRSYDVEHVPQIWGAVMVLMKGSRTLVSKWIGAKEWLVILQKCFNKSDQDLNRSAWHAWRHTVFAAGSLLTDNEAVMKCLSTPVYGSLQREVEDDRRFSVHDAAYATLYLLLYYAFGQPLDQERTDLSWRKLVHETSRNVLEKNRSEASHLASIIATLLAGNGLKLWKADRGLVDSPLSLCDLPRLDPFWVRHNIDTILETVRLFINGEPTPAQTPILAVWTSLVKSLSQAGEREIMPSADARRAASSMYGFLVLNYPDGAPEELMGALKSLPIARDESILLRQAIPAEPSQSQEAEAPATDGVHLESNSGEDERIASELPQGLAAGEEPVDLQSEEIDCVSDHANDASKHSDRSLDSASSPSSLKQDNNQADDLSSSPLAEIPSGSEIPDIALLDGASSPNAGLQQVGEGSFQSAQDNAGVAHTMDTTADETSHANIQIEVEMNGEITEATDEAIQVEIEEDDCIILQDAESDTPPLRDLLRARGVLLGGPKTDKSLTERLREVIQDARSATRIDAGEIEMLEDMGLELLKELSLLRRRARA